MLLLFTSSSSDSSSIGAVVVVELVFVLCVSPAFTNDMGLNDDFEGVVELYSSAGSVWKKGQQNNHVRVFFLFTFGL